MVTNYYNASNNFSAPIRREPKPFRPCPEREHEHERNEVVISHGKEIKQELDRDTVLILGLVILLLISGCEDKLLLIALGYLILF